MRVLLALDGSASAESARRLVRALHWPEGTVIEVVAVEEPIFDPLVAAGLPLAGLNADIPDAVSFPLQGVLIDAVAALEAPGRVVTRALLSGRPASVIVNEAAERRTELIVVGSRGLGPLRSMLLGSVSAEVVDHAPCPVLVVRGGDLERILLAVDGSAPAEAAITFLAGCRFLAERPVEVLTVATAAALPIPDAAAGYPDSAFSDNAFDAYQAATRTNRERAEAIAASAAARLRSEGIDARWSISQGNPAHEIIEAATAFRTDLVVLGSRGHTGLTRVLLGSVARNVLLHAEASVLIVREPLRVRSAERAPGRDTAIDPAGRSPLGRPVNPSASPG
jgi:nucleotide-binding universal stress UspA family protein